MCLTGMLICLSTSAQLSAADGLTGVLPESAVGSTVYVLASRASVYTDIKAATISAKPVINTPVKLIARKENWCEVEVLPAPAIEPSHTNAAKPSKIQHGYIDCHHLTPEPLTIAWIENQIAQLPAINNRNSGKKSDHADGKALLEWAARAFWVAPSLGRWANVGVALENSLLNVETRNQEISGGKPLRFRVDDFEAMKQRLAKGISVNPKTYKPDIKWALNDPMLQYMNVKTALPKVKLPPGKPSFFNADNIPVMFPSAKYSSLGSRRAIALIDALSASNLTAYKAVVTAPASYVLNREMPLLAQAQWRFIRVSGAMEEIAGIWDVGGLDITFDKKVFLHGVTAQGEPIKKGVTAVKLGIGYDSSCSYSPSYIEMASTPVDGYPPADSSLLMWAGMPMPGGAKSSATIKSRRIEGDTDYSLVIAHEIDLDRDAVPDFVVWQGRYVPQVSAEGLWQATFANIGGQWFVLDYEEDSDCT